MKRVELKKIKAVIFDVDGTLFDVREGYARGINDALFFHGFKKIDKGRIIRMRRSGLNAFKIVRAVVGDDERLPYVEDMRKNSRETIKYRQLDRPFKKAEWTLSELKRKKKKIFIASLRESKSFLVKQLTEFGLEKYIDDVFVISENPSGKNHDLMKKILIKQFLKKHHFEPNECVIVGDTVADIRGGKQTGIRTIALTTGMEGREFLEKEKPDMILNEISMITKIIN